MVGALTLSRTRLHGKLSDCHERRIASLYEFLCRKGYLSESQARFAADILKHYWQPQWDSAVVSGKVRQAYGTPFQRRAILVGERTLRIEFPKDMGLIQKVRTLPGRKFLPKELCWTAPLCDETVAKLREWGFRIDPSAEGTLKQRHEYGEVVPIEVPGLRTPLYQFQKEGVGFVDSRSGRALIGDEMGLGKTPQSLGWIHYRTAYPAVVVCPTGLKNNWLREIRKFLPPGISARILSGRTADPYWLNGADIVMVNYDILADWLELLSSFAISLVFDEAHYLKNNKAIRTRAAKQLAKKVRYLMCLTGTPIVNRPREFFELFKMIDPTIFPDRFDYRARFCGATALNGWDDKGASNTLELHRIATGTIMLRRLKADVLADLPAKARTVVPLDIENRSEYDRADRDFARWLREEADALKGNIRQATALTKIEALKQLSLAGKMGGCLQWIEDFLEEADKLVLFTMHRDTVAAVRERFGAACVSIQGGDSPIARRGAEDAFQTKKSVRIIVGNIAAMGVGLNLTAASNVAFMEEPWSPGLVDQAEDRCHRIGQSDSVNVWHLIATDTIEEWLIDILCSKQKTLAAVLDGKEEVDRETVIADLLRRYRAKGEKCEEPSTIL